MRRRRRRKRGRRRRRGEEKILYPPNKAKNIGGQVSGKKLFF